jgi:enamine deaminase RidA (YjgF/YER057c/UK114 family)
MPVEVRVAKSSETEEIYITAIPSSAKTAPEQAEEVFGAVRRVLGDRKGRILQERVFAEESVLEMVSRIRTRVYGELDDGVTPTQLAVPVGGTGDIAGIQVHALCSQAAPQPLRLQDRACGRVVGLGGRQYVTLSGLAAPEAGSAPQQARAVFEKAESALRQIGAGMQSVARTWLWLDRILDWYGDFNRVRNRFFSERGILNGNPASDRPPASTGIGVRLAGRRPSCGLDLVAVVGERDSIRHYRAGGHQQSPCEYGSAFSRAARAVMPAGETVFVSGTAAIDAQGRTEYIGDARRQIEATIAHVRAVLRDMNCTDDDVVQAIVYSRTPEVEKVFRSEWKRLTWPCVLAIGDICRDDLLFEVEATACPGARRLLPS